MSRVAVLTSGGLDSYVAYRYAQHMNLDPKLVFVDYGQPYLQKEIDSLVVTGLWDEAVKVKADCAHPHLDNVPTVTQQEVFGRNLLLAYYGALVAPEVWMIALSTETGAQTVRDKQPEFFHMTSALLSFILRGRQPETVVKSPFAHMTKTDEVELALKIGITQDEIRATSSCYDPVVRNCGVCSTCSKRAIALVNNGMWEDYAVNPFDNNPYFIRVVNEMLSTDDIGPMARYSLARRMETHNAIIMAEQAGLIQKNNVRYGILGTNTIVRNANHARARIEEIAVRRKELFAMTERADALETGVGK